MSWDTLFAVPILALLSAGICLGQTQRPAPDPVQRAVTTARNEGRLTDAEKLLRDAIHDLEKNDPESPRIPQFLRELAGLVSRDGRNAEAQALWERAYEIDRAAFGPNDLRITPDITNLAWTAQGMGDSAKAERLFNQALQIARANEANLHTLQDAGMVAGDVGTLISFYITQQRWVDAELLMPEEEKLCDLIPQPYRSGYGNCGNLSGVYEEIYRGEGRTAGLEQLPQDQDFPADLVALNRAAEKYEKDGLYPSAEEVYGRAIALAEKLDADDRYLYLGLRAREREALGRLYEAEGLNDRAEQIYLDQLEATKRKAGPEPGQKPFAAALDPFPLVMLYEKEKRLPEAEQLLEGVLEIQVSDLGERHRAVVNTLTTLAGVYEQDGRNDKSKYTQARALYERAIGIEEANRGPRDREVVSLLRQYAQVLDEIPDEAKAEEVRARIAASSRPQPQQ